LIPEQASITGQHGVVVQQLGVMNPRFLSTPWQQTKLFNVTMVTTGTQKVRNVSVA